MYQRYSLNATAESFGKRHGTKGTREKNLVFPYKNVDVSGKEAPRRMLGFQSVGVFLLVCSGGFWFFFLLSLTESKGNFITGFQGRIRLGPKYLKATEITIKTAVTKSQVKK